MNGPVHPPCWKPPSVSSPVCPGPWITPSSEVYSMTAILLMVLSPVVVKFMRADQPRGGPGKRGPRSADPGSRLAGVVPATAVTSTGGPLISRLRDALATERGVGWRPGLRPFHQPDEVAVGVGEHRDRRAARNIHRRHDRRGAQGLRRVNLG